VNGGQRPVGDDDIEAFIDGRIDPARGAEVERYLEGNPVVRARVFTDRAIKAELRARLEPVAAEPIPPRLRIGTILARRKRTGLRRLGLAAASVALLGTGTGVGWVARGPGQAPARNASAAMVSEGAEAIAAHRVFVVETAHPVEVAASQQAHLIQWLSRRVGQPLKIPDLSAQGFELMGGRVLPSSEGPAAQFMYEDGGGHRLTLYVRADAGGDTAFRFARSGDYSAFSWIDGGLGFAMVASADRPRLLGLAEATYRQLDPAAAVLPAAR
jgi:anti-sigma factor RsiW